MPGERRRCAADLHAAGLRARRRAHRQQQLLHGDLQVVHAAGLRARRRAQLRANPYSNPNPNPILNPNPNPHPKPNPNQATRTTTRKATRNKATRKATRSRDTRSRDTRSRDTRSRDTRSRVTPEVTPRALFAWLLGRRPAPGQQQLQQQHRRLRRQQEQQEQHQKSGRRRVAGTLASASKVHRRLLGREVVSASVERSVGPVYTHNVMSFDRLVGTACVCVVRRSRR